jgi:phenylacetate-CoA ligase
MTVVPVSSGNTARHHLLLQDFRPEVIAATPSFALHLAETLAEQGGKPRELGLRVGVFGAEPWTNGIRAALERAFDLVAFDIYGLSEIIGPGVAGECEARDGLHIADDQFLPEIIDPVSGEALPPGREGELVFTTLTKRAMPLIRYRTGDITTLSLEPCRCGRTSARMARVKGRSDDMLIINGVNVFPSQVEEVIMAMPEIANNYLIVVEKSGAMDKMTVKTEVVERYFTDDARDLNALKRRIEDRLCALITIHPSVELHQRGVLPASEGKAKRVLDERPKE